jgi:4-aminobutyrate--pyruvate transaminase
MLPPRSFAARDVASLLHPFTEINRHAEGGPMIIDRGEGVYVFDQAGNRYLEGMAGLWCASLGFSERRLIEAALRQMERLPAYRLFGGKTYAAAVELAERLLALAPVPMARVLFAGSGSEANDTAIKLVRYYNHVRGRPEKRKIIARARAYHGATLAAASLNRPAARARALQPAARRLPAYGVSASLPLRACGRERGGVRLALRRESRPADRP